MWHPFSRGLRFRTRQGQITLNNLVGQIGVTLAEVGEPEDLPGRAELAVAGCLVGFIERQRATQDVVTKLWSVLDDGARKTKTFTRNRSVT